MRFNPLAAKQHLDTVRDRAFALHDKMHEQAGDVDEPDDIHHLLHFIMGVQ